MQPLSESATLQKFIDSWYEIEAANSRRSSEIEFAKQLHRFVDAWPINAKRSEKRASSSHVDPKDLAVFLGAFEPSFQQLASTGALCNFWEVAGIGRDEVRVTKILCWLMNPWGSHGQGGRVAEAIWRELEAKHSTTQLSCFPRSSVFANRLAYRTETEVYPMGSQENRVDIHIEGPDLLLFIEVKIDARQGAFQLDRYYEECRRIVGADSTRKWGIVYLTPTGAIPLDVKARDQILSLRWNDVALALRKYASEQENASLITLLLGQFSDYISRF